MSTEKTECNQCDGRGYVHEKLRDKSGKSGGQFVEHVVNCPKCNGKGFITKADIEDYYKTWNL